VIGVLGGTFDPVHHGHLRLALELREGLGLDEVRMVPARVPPHREVPIAAAADRLAMLEAALADTPGLVLDPRELAREGPSYTVDTLQSMRAQFSERPLCLLLGIDAFAGLHTWHRWELIPELAHIGVARRPGAEVPIGGEVAKLLAARRVQTPEELRRRPAGAIHILDIPALEISGTRIRGLIARGRNPRFLLPDAVLRLIEDRGLYIAND